MSPKRLFHASGAGVSGGASRVGDAGVAAGCGAAGGGGIPNLNSSAAALQVENLFYNSSRMETTRYSHTATELINGQILVVGGTDERHVTSLDTVELFDQSVTPDGPVIDSITGIWFDTDFQGDTITMKNGGRIFHTASPLSSGDILVAGGAPDSLNAAGHADSEIYQVQSRLFDPEELQIPDGSDMVEARFHHVAIRQPNGKIMFMGGQRTQDETVIDPNFFPGDPRFMIELTVFPSTESIEEFDPVTRTFSRVKDASGADTERIPNRLEHDLDLTEVFPLLCGPPLTPRIVAYPPKIELGRPGYAKFLRARQKIRPTPGPNPSR